jgi:transposase/IS5 family transposase
MLGHESEQRSFFDASLAVEAMLEPGSFYEVLCREGPRLLSDEDFADCYDVTTGRPSVPPSRMFKLLLLQIFEGLSDRQALDRMAFDLRWKAVLGLEVHDRAVGQATLVEFRARLQLHEKMEEAFGRFLKRASQVGLVSPDEVQVLDSTAIWGRGAVEDTYNLIGSAVHKLLGATARGRGKKAEVLAKEIGLVLTAPAEGGSLKGRAGIDWSVAEERRAFLNGVVGEARLLLEETQGDGDISAEVIEAADLLRRILVQDLECVNGSGTSEDGGGPKGGEGDTSQSVLSLDAEVQIRQGVAKDRVVSVGDPEMRHGHKSHNRRWDGYKAHVSVTAESEFVTAVEVTAANVHDGKAARELIEGQEQHGLTPEAYVGDMAYSFAELRHWVAEADSEMVAAVPPATTSKGCFSKDAFTVDLEEGTVTCPAGQTTRRVSQQASGRPIFHFNGQVCAGCTKREACTHKKPEAMRRTGRGRSISLHPLEAVLQHAREIQRTERVQKLLGYRSVVERRISHLMGRGLRQARYRGRPKVQFQALATALVVNLVRMGALVTEKLGSSLGSRLLPRSPLSAVPAFSLHGTIHRLRASVFAAFSVPCPQLQRWAFRSVS